MKYNPCKEHDFVLGGAFKRDFPLLNNKTEPTVEIWNWESAKEPFTLLNIYDFFKESWKLIEQKTDQNPDLILIGTGISMHDILPLRLSHP